MLHNDLWTLCQSLFWVNPPGGKILCFIEFSHPPVPGVCFGSTSWVARTFPGLITGVWRQERLIIKPGKSEPLTFPGPPRPWETTESLLSLLCIATRWGCALLVGSQVRISSTRWQGVWKESLKGVVSCHQLAILVARFSNFLSSDGFGVWTGRCCY